MYLLGKPKSGKKQARRQASRKQPRKRAGKAVQRTKREGAGRPSLHPGKDLSRHASAYLTEEGWDKLAECQERLIEMQKAQKAELKAVTVSDAIEEAIHRLHKDLTRPR